MVSVSVSRAAAVRARVGHPIIDSDGHSVELTPLFLDYVKQIGGGQMADQVAARLLNQKPNRWFGMSPEERRDSWADCPSWWLTPTRNTLDRATASLPRLLHERMDDLGIDFTILYGTVDMRPSGPEDSELQRVATRALNAYRADLYREYSDRMTPAAMIPMGTSEEAIEDLHYAVVELGLKVIGIAPVRRPVPRIQREHPGLVRYAMRWDTFGIDSDYDYDPFWKKCLELKVAPTSHGGSKGVGTRQSISNYMYNHIGHFGAAGEAFCKSLIMGGVTRRFPSLKFAFLEGGVGWACALYADMIGHWQKRGPVGLQNMDPANLDRELFMQLMTQYGDKAVRARLEDVREFIGREQPRPPALDDFAQCGVEGAEDFRAPFESNFFFGCEADDPMNAWAFNTRVNPFGARLRPILSSDIGHWDVSDMSEVVEEAYELVEHELITPEDLRDFVYRNPVSLHAGMNPDFFKGTRCEADVARLLEKEGGRV
jgi:predicted TIM-barrel fold metal-dependent hydrolase